MKVVLTGAKGQLGQTFLRRRNDLTWSLVALDSTDCDITSFSAVERVMNTHAPQVIINCAAYTAVDKAETDRDRCHAVNAEGPANLARVARSIGARLVHVSTDYVFDGKAQVPYTEQSPTSPLGEYGRSKLVGEHGVLEHNPDALIVRTSWLYGMTGHNFIRAILKRAKEKGELKVVNDQVGSPTCTEALADCIAKLLTTLESGIFHITNCGQCTWHDFASEIIHAVGWHDVPVATCRTEELNLPAPRPAFSVMDNARWRALGFYPTPDWRDQFRDFFERFKRENPELVSR
jgi:dTDP-4-dehydrorhamnose reductase